MDDDGTTTAATGRWQRARRHRGVVLLVGVLLGALLATLLAGGAPVGHFRSAEGRATYLAAYDAAMDLLPEPDAVTDLRTSYGVVRVYRFDREGDAGDQAGDIPGDVPFLLLPGRASGTPVWEANLPGLQAQRTVYAADLLGEPGRSIQDRPIQGAPDQAAWLDEVIALLPVDRVHVVGLSIGGWTAANLAAHRPERIASLILVEPILVFADLRFEAIIRSIPASVPWLPRSWRDGFSSWTAGGAPVEEEPVAAMIEAGMQHHRLALPAPSRIPEAALADVAVPTLVILAGDSPMHNAAAAAEVAGSVLQDGAVRVYEGASHAVNGEHPDRITADVASHLARVEGR